FLPRPSSDLDLGLAYRLRPAVDVGDAPAGLADALDQPAGGDRPGDRIDQSVFDRRRSGVDHQYVCAHRPSSPAAASSAATCCACTAVMATVLTMSVTVAPRDRSLTGRRSPCSTGPIAIAPAERCTAL